MSQNVSWVGVRLHVVVEEDDESVANPGSKVCVNLGRGRSDVGRWEQNTFVDQFVGVTRNFNEVNVSRQTKELLNRLQLGVEQMDFIGLMSVENKRTF